MSEPPRGPVLAVVAVVVVVVFVAVRACDDDTAAVGAASAEPPDPPAPPPLRVPPVAPASPLGMPEGPVLGKRTLLRYRLESCYYGALGVPYAREAYWESLGPNAPSALHLPSFGDYPEHRPRRPGGRPPVAATIGRLPFEQHLRACTSAKSLAGDDGGDALGDMAPALAAFEAYAAQAARTLSDAARYYARREYERDGFSQGLALHQQISDALGGFEAQHATFGEALMPWRAALAPTADDAARDAGGRLARDALAAARAQCDALLGGQASDAAALERATAALRGLGEQDGAGVFPRMLGPALDALREAVAGATPPLSHHQRYRIGHAMAELLDADQRALARHIGGDGGDGDDGDRLRPTPPKLRASARPK